MTRHRKNRGAQYNAGDLEYWTFPDGRMAVKLANGVVRVYTEEEMGEIVVTLLHQCDHHPDKVDENWLNVVKNLVGEEKWNQALQIYAAVGS